MECKIALETIKRMNIKEGDKITVQVVITKSDRREYISHNWIIFASISDNGRMINGYEIKIKDFEKNPEVALKEAEHNPITIFSDWDRVHEIHRGMVIGPFM